MKQAARLAHVGHWEWTVASGELRWSDETFACFGYKRRGGDSLLRAVLQHVDPQDQAGCNAAVQKSLDMTANPMRWSSAFAAPMAMCALGLAMGEV
jgi:hypothetical protein